MIDPAIRQRWRDEGHWRDYNLGQALAAAAATRPEAMLTLHSAIRPERYTLRYVHERGRLIAGSLAASGLQAGDVVALQLPNWIEAALVWQGAAALGCVVLPIVTIYGETELDFTLRDAKARILFVPRRWGRGDPLERVRRLGALPDLREIVVVDGAGERGVLD
ncbi:MAG: AMP-binding protein, partial [Janthinobacterium lividum]